MFVATSKNCNVKTFWIKMLRLYCKLYIFFSKYTFFCLCLLLMQNICCKNRCSYFSFGLFKLISIVSLVNYQRCSGFSHWCHVLVRAIHGFITTLAGFFIHHYIFLFVMKLIFCTPSTQQTTSIYPLSI